MKNREKVIWPEDFINKIICGDNLSAMKKMPDECIDMAITSPPYWGLRDYGFEQIFGGDPDCEHDFGIIHRRSGDKSGPHGPQSILGSIKKAQYKIRKGEPTKTCSKCQAWKGQLGLEPTPGLYIEHLTEIFNEIKRILKKRGTLWLNIGDTYNAGRSGGWPGGKKGIWHPENAPNQSGVNVKDLPQKCLTMIPERLAWSLIQNGWTLRNKIIWFKPNSMPSSVKDRFNNKWEYLFLFSKDQKYYFDLDAVREPHKYDGRKDTIYKGGPKDMQIGKHERWPDPEGKNPGDVINTERKWDNVPGQTTQSIARDHGGWHRKDGSPTVDFEKGKNPDDFWPINTQPFPDAHFAVFPEKLCEKPIKAGCPEEICKKCGKARERITEPSEDYEKYLGKSWHDHSRDAEQGAGQKKGNGLTANYKTIGWTFCNCKAGFEGGIVLDPFCGVGTALYVAKEMRRRFIGIDIKKEYCELAEKRLAQGVL